MHIKKVRARRFLSVGEEWVEIDFTTLGRIINIRGSNLDYGTDASNGAGKSTIIEMLVCGLFGKLQKGHKSANHIYSTKGYEIELWVDDLKIIRKGKPHSLTIYEDGKELKLGGVPATQEELIKRIRLTYAGFVNVACFGQHSFHGFLDGDAAHKRSVAENLLSFDHYARYHEIAKKQKAFLAESLRELEIKFDAAMENLRRANSKVMTHRAQQAQWQKNRISEVVALEARLAEIVRELTKPTPDLSDRATGEIERIDRDIVVTGEKRNKCLKAIKQADIVAEDHRVRYEESQRRLVRVEAQLRESEKLHKRRHAEIKELEATKGTKCPKCYSIVREENLKPLAEELKKDFLAAGHEVESLRVQLQVEQTIANEAVLKHEKVGTFRTKHKKEESEYAMLLNALMLERSEWVARRPAREQQIGLLKEKEMLGERIKQSRQELTNNDPFTPLVQAAEAEMKELHQIGDDLKVEIDQKKRLVPYYDYWVRGFGDKGIRSFLLEERLPILNRRINFWLQILIDSKLKVLFDRDLNETIKRVPDDSKNFVYNSLSGGELMRIDLSISQAFAYVTMVTSQACPSLIALDEVGNHFDRPGKQAVYRMICELAKDRQVLVITHDRDLLDMLQTCDTLLACMENGVTRIEVLKGGTK